MICQKTERNERKIDAGAARKEREREEKGMSREMISEILQEVKQSVVGKDEIVEKVLCALLARGHILIEDIPGVGKTTLAMAFARAIDLEANRMQFTPDVLPADIIGFHLYQKDSREFEYQKGPIMCNVFLADEINRTSPKTQSALLEVMEEGTVTIDGVTRPVPNPFLVIATQNPAGSAGTQLLPESQLDRFMIKLTMGYPNRSDEITILKQNRSGNHTAEVHPVASADDILQMQEEVSEVYVHHLVDEYAVRLAEKTRESSFLELGISPRGTIALIRMAQARAYVQGRNYVLPEDVRVIFRDVAEHRVLLSTKARVSHIHAAKILEQILDEVPAPRPKK